MINPGKISSFNSPILVEVDHKNIFKLNLFFVAKATQVFTAISNSVSE